LWPSEGPVAVAWIQDNLIQPEGDFFGQPFRLREDQQLFLYRWYEYCRRCRWWRYDEGVRGAATGDGKTTFIAAIGLLEFGGPPQIAPTSPIVPIAAAAWDQADELFRKAGQMVGGQDDEITEAPLCGFFEVYDTKIQFRDGRPGVLERVAAVAGTNEGGLPHLFIGDELHEWGEVGSRKARVHTVIGKSTKKRMTARGPGRILDLSTAGFDKDRSLLGAMYQRGQRALHDPSTAPKLLFDWQEAPEGLDYDDPEDRRVAVRAASQAADVLWDVESRVRDWGKPDMPRHEWIRYYANRWVDIVEDSWLKDHPGAWEDCKGTWTPDDANPWVLVVDMALRHDSVAVTRIEQLPDGRLAATTRIWRADQHGGRIPHDDVWVYIRQHARGLGFRGVVYDPRFFEVPARLLEDDGIQVIEFDQSPQRMAPACGLAYDLILQRRIVHDDDPDFAAHVKGAVAVPQERGGFTLKKGKSKGHIDAAVTLCMGVWILHEAPEPAPIAIPLVAWE
jgi:phage terminase large subunit-like protein